MLDEVCASLCMCAAGIAAHGGRLSEAGKMKFCRAEREVEERLLPDDVVEKFLKK